MKADVLVIGSGQAGGPLAWRLARNGRSVVLFERARLGGTCVNYGCTPTKTFLASARAAHEARRAGDFGVETGEVRVDMDAVVDRKDAVVETWRSAVARNVEEAGDALTLVREHARLTGPGTLAAGGTGYEADTIIVNVGGRLVVPDLPGLGDVPWLDNASVMSLRRVPEHLLVLGAGYIGCELGQAFHRLGARVTLVERNGHVMAREDEDVARALQEALEDEGMGIRAGVEAVGVEAVEGGGGATDVRATDATGAEEGQGGIRLRLSDGSTLEGSHLLVAVGRRPNTDDLGCEAAGVELDEGGAVVVDRHYRTTADGVYAVGDCTGGPAFTHTSWDDHRILFDLLTGSARRNRTGRTIPYSTFTDPQLARVGLSERQAEAEGVEVEVATLPFSHIARARETDRTPGLVKLLVDPGTERIRGAAVVGAEAAELIHVPAVLMEAGASARALADSQIVHPAFAEGLQTALMSLDRYALS